MRVHIALEKPGEDRPSSIDIYFKHIKEYMQEQGVTFTEGRYDDPDAAPGTDIVWAPGMGNRRLPKVIFQSVLPTVVTLHGLQYLTDMPMIRSQGLRQGLGHFVWRLKIRADWLRMRKKVTAVISVSNTLTAQIQRRLHVPSEKIHVIPHGVTEQFFLPSDVHQDAQGEYILHLSQYSGVKNLERMMDAYAMVRQQIGLPFRLISVGHPPELLPPEGCDLISEPTSRHNVPDLMRNAHAFLFPSLEESFGLPVLEAMASGVPVVTSLGTGAGEVAGDAAVLVDPKDTSAIAEGLLRCATDTNLRCRLREAGQKRAKQFTWQASGEQHLTLFRALLESRPG
ncbi:MAG: glycosyltransferase family 1 protein [Pseudomonadota bacterium]